MSKPIPKISDLVKEFGDKNLAYEKDSLNELLNQQPYPKWIKEHPIAKSKYIPIDKIEYLLTRIFQEWRVEVLREQVMFNSIAVTVRLHVCNPITNEWTFHDGCGAMNVQTDAGKSAADLGAIKSAAVQMAFPSAKTYAIKDAAEHFGAIFGRDLNRRDIMQFTGAHEAPAPSITERMGLQSEPTPQYEVTVIAEAPKTQSIYSNNYANGIA
jgi:hypothetical protein